MSAPYTHYNESDELILYRKVVLKYVKYEIGECVQTKSFFHNKRKEHAYKHALGQER